MDLNLIEIDYLFDNGIFETTTSYYQCVKVEWVMGSNLRTLNPAIHQPLALFKVFKQVQIEAKFDQLIYYELFVMVSDAIIIPEKYSALITSEAVKASAGALNYVSICKEKSLKNVVNQLKESGLKIISCTEKCEETIYSIDFNCPVCIILGSEKDGISQNLIEISDIKAKIPMKGEIESLNVSSSSSVILYELIRQRN